MARMGEMLSAAMRSAVSPVWWQWGQQDAGATPLCVPYLWKLWASPSPASAGTVTVCQALMGAARPGQRWSQHWEQQSRLLLPPCAPSCCWGKGKGSPWTLKVSSGLLQALRDVWEQSPLQGIPYCCRLAWLGFTSLLGKKSDITNTYGGLATFFLKILVRLHDFLVKKVFSHDRSCQSLPQDRQNHCQLLRICVYQIYTESVGLLQLREKDEPCRLSSQPLLYLGTVCSYPLSPAQWVSQTGCRDIPVAEQQLGRISHQRGLWLPVQIWLLQHISFDIHKMFYTCT